MDKDKKSRKTHSSVGIGDNSTGNPGADNSSTGTTAGFKKELGSSEACECSAKSAVSGLDAQLNKNLNVLKAGPMLMVTPAQHLLSSALRFPKGAKRSLIDKNLARLRSHEETEDGGIGDERDLVNDLDREDDDSLSLVSDNNSDYEGQNEDATAIRNSDSDNDDEDGEDGISDLRKSQGKELSPENTRSRLSLRHRRTSSSASSRSLEARRQAMSPQRFINSISKHSLSPIKSGVAAIGSPIMHRISSDKVEEPTVEGISRSFAGFLTAASMYAGFQDIEDEDREVESIRNKDFTSADSSTDGELGPPDDATHLQVLDNDDDSDAISGISTPTDTPSVYSGNTIAPAEGKHHVTFDGDGINSKFEVSVAKKVTDNAKPGDQPEVLENKAHAISRKLRETFDISQSEAFIGDYPCWLMGDVLLQGHLYITDNNILFFAFLPKRNKGGISKSGSLSVKSFHSLRMHRKWIILRENTFSVYSSPKDLYFPELVIDLRTALRAEIYGSSKNSNPVVPVWIRIVTEKRTHWFQADNHDVARSWVTILKKHIFSSRNKGDQVAIKIPLQNVIDLELTSVVGVTKNLRIKVIENAESFAIDDYFVMFFSKGDAAVEDIKSAIEKAGVVISSSLIDDNDDLRNSDLVKSKIEIIKKSCSSVKLTNFKPKEKKGKLKGFRDSILSSDEDEGNEGDDEIDDQFGTAEDDEATNVQKHEPIPSKAKSLISSRLRGRSKSIHIVPDLDTKVGLKKVVDTTHPTNEHVPEKEPHRWTSSIVQGITSFTQSLIFSGPVMHFDEESSFVKEGEDPFFVRDQAKRISCQKRFINRFSLNESEKLIATYHLYLLKGLPTYGKLYIGSHEICFRSTIPGTSTVMILPMADIENVNKESGFRFGYFGLVIVIRGHEELFFEFSTHDARDDCEVQILKNLDSYKRLSAESSATENDIEPNLASSAGSLNSARLKMFESKLTDAVGLNVPIIVEEHPLKQAEFKAFKPYRFTLLTIGSRGDVQPYIALGKALLKEGHKVKIVTHAEFKGWVESYGIGFDVIAGDPSELMSLMVSHPSINYSFIREAKAKFRDWIDDLLNTSWKACQDCDVLIESPSSIAGIHIAEKLQIPYFRAFTMPWTRTRAYPNAFMVPDQKLGGAYNYMTHVAFENGYWRGTCYQVNKWRVQTLGLPKTNLGAMHQNSVPFLYNMSPVVFPPSVDFPEWVKVTGYWFLDESASYVPPKELTDFIKKARDDDKKLVYIGFGSIVVDNPKELTQAVVDAVLESDVRCILNKGWSDRLGSKNKNDIEIGLPDEIFNSGNVPHDWLFTQIDAAVHHGGSGSTGASLRFGLPTIIKPFFGDQKFYANRVEDLGCGVALKSLESKHMAKALREITTNKRIIEKAKVVGEKIRSENGVQNAINAIYVLMDYATKLSISKHKQDLADDEQEGFDDSNDGTDIDGSWLLV